MMLILAFSFITKAEEIDEKSEREIEASLSTFQDVAKTTDLAINGILKISIKELNDKGYSKLAKELEKDWKRFDGFLVRGLLLNRDIGWFEPLIEWLALAYESIELALGIELCRSLRISDLKTINHGIVVVFRPCHYGESEFKLHFIHDEKYRGFAPVISYWAAAISCTAALHGAGYFFVCSPAAMVIERVVDKRIAPRVAPKLYKAACSA